ncbi:hypothetical protein RGQ13_09020 [Thalassotalea psychrophila]|uniref:Uncharacterized protein n=1 Tax=Thalassotalea psychrophila TaxID=3065647 RepID=A0ABY9TZ16_9GAMM|nr:hypothetical protein RGQ13_09020 [Colwelliaceae bacterium SQ149]
MQEKRFVEIGSNLDKAVQGDYKLDVQAIFKEGWTLTKTNKQAILSGLVFVFLMGIIITMVAAEYMGGIETVMQNNQSQVAINLIITVLLWPFIAGIEMMGISHAVGIKTRTGFVFAFLKRSAYTAITALIIASITSIGFYLILPGIYLAVALSLTIPLIVEKNMSPINSIVLSLKATRFQWFKLLQIYSLLLLAALLSLLPGFIGFPPIIAMVIFFVAMGFLAPLYYNIKGILYREIFGVRMQVIGKPGEQDTFFSA